MNHAIAWPEASYDTPLPIGGKAGALTALVDAGLPIPAFFTVLPPERAEMSPALRDAVLTAYDRLCPDGAMVAVRSSAVEEDSAGHSFAGQFDSFLFVTRERLVEKVAAVWRSGGSDRVVVYRKERGIEGGGLPAVLVQRMVNATAAGVAFAADPVTGRRGVALVSAVWGLGSALVSGEADADTFSVNRAGEVIARTMAVKRMKHVMDGETEEGVRSVAVEGSQVEQPAISDEIAAEVAAVARATSKHFGRPQDIEWAVAEGKVFLLQSRPITSLGGMADPEGVLQIWDNSNIAESYSGVTTPLTFSFARHAYEGVYKEFCRLMKVPGSVIADHHAMFANMLGLIRGRVYYNLLNWYRMLALLPGFAINRKFMEGMMGVKEGLPEEMVRALSAATWQDKLRDGARLAWTVVGLVWNHLTLPGQIKGFYARLDRAMAPPPVPMEMMRPDELVAYFRTLERQLLTRWDAPLVNDFFAMIFYGVLRKQCEKIDLRGTLQNDLLCAEGGIISTEPARRIREMAEQVVGDAELVQLLLTAQRREIERAVRGRPELERAYRAYLAKFGHRCLEELKLESATLHDDPLPLWRSVGGMAQRLTEGHGGDASLEPRLRAEAEAKVHAALGGSPVRGKVFAWVLGNARARVRDRENLRFERTRLFGRVREIFVELGRRLHAERKLEMPRDVFYLTLEELLGFVEGTATCTDLAELAALRKKEFAAYRDELPTPADRVETRGAVHLGNDFVAAAKADAWAEDGEVRSGIGCCPGVVRGRARVISDPRGARIEKGEILVALRTDPGWIMLFPAAAGVAVEHGSLLSHSAIVAREMGIPAVVSVGGITAWLKTGDLVELDGKAGTVRRVAEEQA